MFTVGATYFLFNRAFGKVLELDPSAATVQAGYFDGGSCQQWEFIPVAEGFIIRCSGGRKDGRPSPAYLNFDGGLRNGETLRAGPRPMVWHIGQQEDMVRVLFSSKFCADLDVLGKRKVQLQSVKNEQCQFWYPSRCDLASFLQRSTIKAHDQRAPVDAMANDAKPDKGAAPVGPGALVLTNPKSDTVLALVRGTNGRPFECKCHSGANTHKEPNELWTFIPSGAGFLVQSGMVTADGQPLYLTVEGPAVADAAIVAKPYPVSWEVRRCEIDQPKTIGYRVYWPGTDLLVAPAKLQEGSKGEGMLVQLTQCHDVEHEVWRAVLP